MRENYRRPPPLAGTTAVRKSLRDGLDQWSGRRESNPHGQLGRHAKHTLGLLLTVTVCAASVQDRDGAKTALLGAYLTAPACRFVNTDATSNTPDKTTHKHALKVCISAAVG
ncbi:hypothetical protein AB0F43_18015 [Kribbella sp. NPDC023972]|uniref:hypothetical protein n=1 Tax=Kribbella sp. NPDC023972 TaxID=3154795 RepID=UPI0033FC27AE